MEFFAGNQFVLLELTAATTDMSSLFSFSNSILRVMKFIARKAGAYAAFLDYEEDETWNLLFPLLDHQYLPNVSRPLWSFFEEVPQVDKYCLQAIQLANIPLSNM